YTRFLTLPQIVPLLITAMITNLTLYGALLMLTWHTQVRIQISLMSAFGLPMGVSMLTWVTLTMVAWKEVFAHLERAETGRQ
ncbi:hypothetical protein KRR22_14490, partial [Lactiplantibacillus plantarum]|nr:hypothetical protein [Lactiplantibacillus plantarum]